MISTQCNTEDWSSATVGPGCSSVLCSQVCGGVPGVKFAVQLPGCAHQVKLPFPMEPCMYITFKFGGCPKCKKAAEASGGS